MRNDCLKFIGKVDAPTLCLSGSSSAEVRLAINCCRPEPGLLEHGFYGIVHRNLLANLARPLLALCVFCGVLNMLGGSEAEIILL